MFVRLARPLDCDPHFQTVTLLEKESIDAADLCQIFAFFALFVWNTTSYKQPNLWFFCEILILNITQNIKKFMIFQ